MFEGVLNKLLLFLINIKTLISTILINLNIRNSSVKVLKNA